MIYVKCKFNTHDERSYTYHLPDYIDIEDVKKVKLCIVMTNDGLKVIKAVSITKKKPEFETKPIVALPVGDHLDKYLEGLRDEKNN